MKLVIAILFIPILAFGQEKTVETDLRNGSIALGSWSVINMVTAASLVKNADGEALHFHQMNGYWNVVNGSLAAYSLISPYIVKKKDASESEMARRYQKIFLINAGLDIVYMTSGGLLNHYSGTKNTMRNEGFGSSLMLQGGFLLAYDLWMAHRMKRWTNNQMQSQLNIRPTSYGISLSYQFD